MKVTIFLFLIGLLFLVGCSTEPAQEPETKTFIIDENPKPKQLVFEVATENPNGWLEASRDERNRINRIRALHEFEEDEDLFQRESELRNVRRHIDGDTIIGYEERLDHPDMNFEYDLTTNDDPDWFEEYAASEKDGVRITFEER